MSPRPLQIVVADDDVMILDVVRHALRSDGYDVIAVKNGELALHQAQFKGPALVILDGSMPVMDGYAALAALKSDATTTSIPVLMLTARRSADDVRRAIDLGASGYIAKPFETRVLLQRVRSILDPAATNAPTASGIEFID